MSTREEVKAKIMQEIEARLDQVIEGWQVEETTLSEIENIALAGGRVTEGALTRVLVEAGSSQKEKEVVGCRVCGSKMRDKGYRSKKLITQTGEVTVRRAYYHCDQCRQGLFPPG